MVSVKMVLDFPVATLEARIQWSKTFTILRDLAT